MVLLILLNNKIYLIYLLIDQYLGGMMLFLRGSADVKERYHLLYVWSTTTYRYMLTDTNLFCSCSQSMDFPSHWVKIPFSVFKCDVGGLFKRGHCQSVTIIIIIKGWVSCFLASSFSLCDSLHSDIPTWLSEIWSLDLPIEQICEVRLCVMLSVICVLAEKGWHFKWDVENESNIEHQHFIGFPSLKLEWRQLRLLSFLVFIHKQRGCKCGSIQGTYSWKQISHSQWLD